MSLATTVTRRRANLLAVYARKAARNGERFSSLVASECIEAAGLAGDELTDRQHHRCENIVRRAMEALHREQ